MVVDRRDGLTTRAQGASEGPIEEPRAGVKAGRSGGLGGLILTTGRSWTGRL